MVAFSVAAKKKLVERVSEVHFLGFIIVFGDDKIFPQFVDQ